MIDDRTVIILIVSILGGVMLTSVLYSSLSQSLNSWNKKTKTDLDRLKKSDKCFICGYQFETNDDRYYLYINDGDEYCMSCKLCNDMYYNYRETDVEYHPFDYALHRLVMHNYNNFDGYNDEFFKNFKFSWISIKQYKSSQTEKNKEIATRYISYLNNQMGYLIDGIDRTNKHFDNKLFSAMANFCNELNSNEYISSNLKKRYGTRCCECSKEDDKEVIMYYRNEKGENTVYCRECVIKSALNGRVFKHISDPRMFLYRDTMNKHLERFIYNN